MELAQQVVVVCAHRGAAPVLEQAIEAEGYQILFMPTAREALATVDDGACAAMAFPVDGGGEEAVKALLEQAAQRLPLSKFIVFSRQGLSDGAAGALPLDMQRLLLVNARSRPAHNVRLIRRFLHGEGYRWASDLAEESGAHGASLLDGARAPGLAEGETARVGTFVKDLSSLTDLTQMLQEALRRYMELLQCDAGSIYLWDERTETLILKAAEGPETGQRLGLRQKLGEGLAGWVAEAGDSILVTDTRKVHKLRGRISERYSNFSCLAAPIMHGNQLFGVVCLTMQKEERPFEPADLRLVEMLSQKLGSLIRPLSFLSELQHFNEKLLGVLKSCSDLVMEKDTQVESMRALSSEILDGIPIGVIAYDAELRVRSANAAAQALFGIQAGSPAAAGAPLEEGLQVDPELWHRKLTGVVEGGGGFRLNRVEHKSCGATRMLDVHCSPLHGPEGRPIGGILTVQDVTEDVELEAKLSANERLALIGKLAAKVAHELNNPLDGILRYLNLAVRRMEEEPDKAREHLEECRRGLLRMSSILTQLLTFSRGHRGASRPVSMSQIVRDSLALYEQRAREINTEIELDVPANLPPCPEMELYETFGNVIKNALDAMGSDGKLRIAASQEGESVRVVISDNGPGVPEEIRDKIFEPFFTTKRNGSGTGLGLAACRDSLARIGGDIRLLPVEAGAAFEIVVPIKQTSE
jgi:two-component system NtrC family sensor kinase